MRMQKNIKYIVKNTLLYIAFSAIWPVGQPAKTLKSNTGEVNIC